MTDGPGLISTGQLASEVGVSRAVVRRWCDRQTSPLPSCRAAKPRSHRRIPRLFAAAWLAEHRPEFASEHQAPPHAAIWWEREGVAA